jgi:hypothetical protein
MQRMLGLEGVLRSIDAQVRKQAGWECPHELISSLPYLICMGEFMVSRWVKRTVKDFDTLEQTQLQSPGAVRYADNVTPTDALGASS